jgi:hypothetical protein
VGITAIAFFRESPVKNKEKFTLGCSSNESYYISMTIKVKKELMEMPIVLQEQRICPKKWFFSHLHFDM